MDLEERLPTILPLAVDWAKETFEFIQNSGITLNDSQIEIARMVGVNCPEKIKLLETGQVPQLNHPVLKEASFQTGLLGIDTNGLTIGYSVFIRSGFVSPRLLSHEFRHVYQYERFGSIPKFIAEYLKQIIEHGYFAAPLEVDATDAQ